MHRVFGLTGEELVKVILGVVLAVLVGIAVYGFVMIRLLKRQAARAKEAAAKAEEHAQAKTRFLAMMSHELRTPLNAVIGFAEFLSREDIDERRRKEYTDGILLSATALLELINDILDLSKLDAGAMEMRSGACDSTSWATPRSSPRRARSAWRSDGTPSRTPSRSRSRTPAAASRRRRWSASSTRSCRTSPAA